MTLSTHKRKFVMNYTTPKHRGRPEGVGQDGLVRYMRARGWWCKKIHGGKFQSGLPDLYCCHPQYGQRWIEMKAPGGKLRSSQVQNFGEMKRHGVDVFVLESEKHYGRLFKNANWMEYMRI